MNVLITSSLISPSPSFCSLYPRGWTLCKYVTYFIVTAVMYSQKCIINTESSGWSPRACFKPTLYLPFSHTWSTNISSSQITPFGVRGKLGSWPGQWGIDIFQFYFHAWERCEGDVWEKRRGALTHDRGETEPVWIFWVKLSCESDDYIWLLKGDVHHSTHTWRLERWLFDKRKLAKMLWLRLRCTLPFGSVCFHTFVTV